MKNKQNTAMVEMGSPEGVDNVMKNLRDITVFGEQVRFDVSKKHQRIVSTPPEFDMPDGSSSVKSYYGARDLNRFMTQEQASKNRIIRPSKVNFSDLQCGTGTYRVFCVGAELYRYRYRRFELRFGSEFSKS
jgi:hypothetical protein